MSMMRRNLVEVSSTSRPSCVNAEENRSSSMMPVAESMGMELRLSRACATSSERREIGRESLRASTRLLKSPAVSTTRTAMIKNRST